VVLVEGFKHGPFPKIEIYRPAIDKPALYPHDPHVIAVASDASVDTRLPQLDINDPEAIAEFVVATLALAQPATGLSI
jgi:molybdopterin-guanine dinucleotide biosynthesis protein B